MWGEKIYALISNPILWGFIALVLAAIAMSGKLSVAFSNLLIVVAFALGCFGIYRLGQGLHFTIILCLVLGGLLTLVSWWIAPTQKITSLPAATEVQEPEKLKTLHDLFLTDFEKTSAHGNYYLTKDGNVTYTVDYIIWLDMDSKTKYLSIFFLASDLLTLQACEFLIPKYDEIVNGNIQSLLKGMKSTIPGAQIETFDELIFSGRIYIYHETYLLPRRVEALTAKYKEHSLSPQFRGRDYLIMKNSPIYEK